MTRNLILFCCLLLTASCSIFDDSTSSTLAIDDTNALETEIVDNIDQVLSGSSLLKEINQQVLATMFQHPSLGLGTDPEDDIQLRSNCPTITPEPGKLRIYPKEFEIDLDSGGSGCQPEGSPTKYKGTLKITVLAPVFLPGGHVIIKTKNLKMGNNLDKEVEDLTMVHKYKDRVNNDLIFDTQISKFEFTNKISRFTSNESKRTSISRFTTGVTTYSDINEDTDLTELTTIIDDLVTIEFASLQLQSEDQNATLEDGKLSFSIICSCPINGQYEDPNGGRVLIQENRGCTDGLFTVRDRNYRLRCD